MDRSEKQSASSAAGATKMGASSEVANSGGMAPVGLAGVGKRYRNKKKSADGAANNSSLNSSVNETKIRLSRDAKEFTPLSSMDGGLVPSAVLLRGGSAKKLKKKKSTDNHPKEEPNNNIIAMNKANTKIVSDRNENKKSEKSEKSEKSMNKSYSSGIGNYKNGKKSKVVAGKSLSKTTRGFTCIICSEESIEYVAIGICDHPICSKCALRVRFKQRNKDCVVCRNPLAFMVVCQVVAEKGEWIPKKYAEINVTSDELPLPPGCLSDPDSQLLFVDCKDHRNEIERMRSFFCPCLDSSKKEDTSIKMCEERLSSQVLLIKHVRDKHSKHMCDLCLTNRPLFIHEHEIFEATHFLKKHKEGKLKNKEHPECRFCLKRFYDSGALYEHMQQKHRSCPMCPVEHQFRFYQGLWELNVHLQQSHLICEHCLENDATQLDRRMLICFSSHHDYTDHTLAVHGIKTSSKMDLSRYFNNASSELVEHTNYVDLELDVSVSGDASVYREPVAGASTAVEPMIPLNMRVAGFVAGGQFHRPSHGSGLGALDTISEAAHSQAAKLRARSGGVWGGNMNAEAFPTLSAERSESTTSKKAESALHSMSLVNIQRAKAAEERELREKLERDRLEQEERRLRRLQRLAEGFDIGGVDASQGLADLNGSVVDVGKSAGSGSNQYLAFAEQLRRPLYTPHLCSWGLKGLADLRKIERKISLMLSDTSTSSIQLKPMSASSRLYMHVLAKYYGINSYEYDREPNRYVSFVKTLDSAEPAQLLSIACQQRPVVLHSGMLSSDKETASLFFSLADGFFEKVKGGSPTLSSRTTASKDSEDEMINMLHKRWLPPQVSLIVSFIKSLLESAGVMEKFAISSVSSPGPNSVSVQFKEFIGGEVCHHLLQKSYCKKGETDWHLLDFFDMQPSFESREFDEEYIHDADNSNIHSSAVVSQENIGHGLHESDSSIGKRAQAMMALTASKQKDIDALQAEIPDMWDDSGESGDSDSNDNENKIVEKADISDGVELAECDDGEKIGEKIVDGIVFGKHPCILQSSTPGNINEDDDEPMVTIPKEASDNSSQRTTLGVTFGRPRLVLIPRSLPPPPGAAPLVPAPRSKEEIEKSRKESEEDKKLLRRPVLWLHGKVKRKGLYKDGKLITEETKPLANMYENFDDDSDSEGEGEGKMSKHDDSSSEIDVDREVRVDDGQTDWSAESSVVAVAGMDLAVPSWNSSSLKASEVNMAWTCKVCTFINGQTSVASDFCEMCDSEKGSSSF